MRLQPMALPDVIGLVLCYTDPDFGEMLGDQEEMMIKVFIFRSTMLV